MPEKIQKGMGYTGISQLLSMGLKFATSVVLARGLGDAAFGLYNVFQSGVDTLAWMLDLGGNSTITKFIADSDTDGNPKASFSTLSSTLVWHALLILAFWGVMAVFSGQIMNIWFDGDRMLLFLFSITVPAAVICGDFIGALYGLRELKYVALRMVTQQGLVALGSLILVFWLGFGVRIAALILAAVWIILGVGLARAMTSYVKSGRLVFNTALVLKPVLKYSLPIGGVYVIETVIRYAPVLLVKAFNQDASNVNQTVASLGLAVFIAGIAESVIHFLVRSGYAYIGRWHRLKQNHLFLGYVLFVTLLTVIIFLLMVFVIKIGLPFFVSAVYGDEYLGVQAYIYWTLLASMFRSLTPIFRTSLYVMGNTLSAFYTSLIEMVLYILIVIATVYFDPSPNWGIRFLQIAALSSAVRVLLLIGYSIKTFKRLESRPIMDLLRNVSALVIQSIKKRFQHFRRP